MAWIAKFHPEVSDAQIAKLLGTTKKTITEIRSRTHWNIAQIKPQDPVTVGICTQMQLDDVVRIAQEKRAAREKKAEKAALAKAAALGTPHRCRMPATTRKTRPNRARSAPDFCAVGGWPAWPAPLRPTKPA